jgi:hypothetical protein
LPISTIDLGSMADGLAVRCRALVGPGTGTGAFFGKRAGNVRADWMWRTGSELWALGLARIGGASHPCRRALPMTALRLQPRAAPIAAEE